MERIVAVRLTGKCLQTENLSHRLIEILLLRGRHQVVEEGGKALALLRLFDDFPVRDELREQRPLALLPLVHFIAKIIVDALKFIFDLTEIRKNSCRDVHGFHEALLDLHFI